MLGYLLPRIYSTSCCMVTKESNIPRKRVLRRSCCFSLIKEESQNIRSTLVILLGQAFFFFDIIRPVQKRGKENYFRCRSSERTERTVSEKPRGKAHTFSAGYIIWLFSYFTRLLAAMKLLTIIICHNWL
jgi:hypothetical protein